MAETGLTDFVSNLYSMHFSYLAKGSWSRWTEFILLAEIQIMRVHDTARQTFPILQLVIFAQPAVKYEIHQGKLSAPRGRSNKR